eukprot:jgi/Picre1/32826/NNA_008156.t1
MLDELRRDIERVVSSGLCKSLVVECGGLHQPMRVADMLRMTDLNDRVAMDTCVTVVDATTMMKIEDAASQLVTLLRSLNPSAKIVQTVQSAVCVEDVVATGMFDYEKTENAAGWAQCMNKSGKVGLFPIGEATDSTASGHGSCARGVEYEEAHGIVPAEVTLSLQEAEKNIKRAIDLVSRGAYKNSKTIHSLNESMKSLQDALVDMSQSTASSSVPGDFEAFKDAYGTIVRSKGYFGLQRGQICAGNGLSQELHCSVAVLVHGVHHLLMDREAHKDGRGKKLHSLESMHDPFAAWPSLDSENDDQNNDEEYMPLGKIVQITDGASEAQHILDSIEPGTTVIIYWHAEWHAQGDAILTELRSMIDKVSTLVIHVKIGDHPPNWSFAMEKVMESQRPTALEPNLAAENQQEKRTPGPFREPESSETTTSVWSDVSSAFPYLQNGAVELRELLKNFGKEKKSLYILWEEGGIPLKILKALESITIIRPDTNNLFIATVGASPGNEALAKALV